MRSPAELLADQAAQEAPDGPERPADMSGYPTPTEYRLARETGDYSIVRRRRNERKRERRQERSR